MSIANEVSRKKLCSEGTAKENVFEILKEILPFFSSLSNEFFDLHPHGFCATTPFMTSSMTTNVFDELLWSTDGDDIYVHYTKFNESSISFSIDKPLVESI
jgi:hypothetical protein